MRNRRSQTSSVEGLRLAIDCMPVATREAMLRGLGANRRIIVGAYVDELGGVCPMLAAHRYGGRTDFLSFAKSWDRFTRVQGAAREASVRELRILKAQLEDSLADEDSLELDEAIREHRALVAAGRSRRRGEGERRAARRLADASDPAGEIRARRVRRGGWGFRGDNPAKSPERRSVSAVIARG